MHYIGQFVSEFIYLKDDSKSTGWIVVKTQTKVKYNYFTKINPLNFRVIRIAT